jgi:hypothetical protein
MTPRTIANQLSRQQRDCLILHLDNPQSIKRGPEFTTAYSLMYRDLLRGDAPNFPRFTLLTELGREVLCAVLGDYADALVRAEIIAVEELQPSVPADTQFAAGSPVQLSVIMRRDLLIERILAAVSAPKKSVASIPLEKL